MNRQKSYTVEEAKRILEKYCAYQERCHQEVEKRLIDLGMIQEARELIILHLFQHDFINEERFAKAYANGKFNNNHWGKLKIKYGLTKKNISSYNIKTGLNEISDDAYLQRLKKLAQKKLALTKESNKYTLKAKAVQFLSSKGYESSLIYKVLDDLI